VRTKEGDKEFGTSFQASPYFPRCDGQGECKRDPREKYCRYEEVAATDTVGFPFAANVNTF
jgi:hypothetical protein